MRTSPDEVKEFITMAQPLYGIRAMENPALVIDPTDPTDLIILNHPTSNMGVWVILNMVKAPVWDALDYATSPQFSARVNRGSFTDYLSRGCQDYWLMFWLSFGGEVRGSYSVLPLTGLWLTKVGKAEKEFRLNPPPVSGDDWIVDVRRFRQIRFDLLTSEDNKV